MCVYVHVCISTYTHVFEAAANGPFHALCIGGSGGAGSEGGGWPEGEPDTPVLCDPFHALCIGGSCDAGGEGEPDGKRQRRCDGFQVIVKMLSGRTIILWCEGSGTVMLKRILYEMMGFIFSDPLNLKLILDGKQLENGRTLGDSTSMRRPS